MTGPSRHTRGKQRRSPGSALTLVAAALLLLGALGCSQSNVKATLDRGNRSEDDLVSLLPRGLDLVLDVDVTDLRHLEMAERLLSLLPEPGLGRLASLVGAPLRNLDALAVGASGLGGSDVNIVVIARGRLDRERIFSALHKDDGASEVEYHGLPLIEHAPKPDGTVDGQLGSSAVAMLSMNTVVLGSRQTVRQVIDIFRSDDDGARSPGPLMSALARAPRAKEGRPALLLALLLTPQLRERLRQAGLPDLGSDAEFLSVALAVGDGLDLGLVVGYRELKGAQEAVAKVMLRTQDLGQRPALSFLGLDRFLHPLVAVAAPAAPKKDRPSPELHLAYRLPGDELAALLDRLVRLQKLQQQVAPAPKGL